MEWARVNSHRGFVASWPQFGAPAGLLLANVAVLTFSWLSGDQFLVWGWRIPFLLSIVMAAVGLYIRLGILETPAFQRLVAEKRIERVPVLEVFKRQPKEIILSALARTGEQAPAYIFLAFVFAYGTQVLHTPRDFLLLALIAGCSASLVATPLSGYLSDRIGRKRMVSHWHDCDGDFRFHLFRHAELPGARIDLPRHHALLSVHGILYGPQAALIAECFTPRLRYSGCSIGYHLASITSGGPAPLIATALLAWTGSGYAIAGTSLPAPLLASSQLC